MVAWSSSDRTPLLTWSFVLDEVDRDSTRLIVRARGGPGCQFHGLPWWPMKRIVPATHVVTQPKHLFEIVETIGPSEGHKDEARM